ncbi:MAG TPA: hypothetical protein VEF33_04080 [Syntrophales bacterium]|nr:hypothetical protein [Syntrophales bacterium]
MKVLLYSSIEVASGKRLQRAIEMLVSKDRIEIYRTIGDFSIRLHQPFDETVIAVLLVCSKKDLMDILSLQELLLDMQIILILPDTDNDTVTKGHTLRPRLIIHCDSDFLEVTGALCRMMRKEKCFENRHSSEDYSQDEC